MWLHAMRYGGALGVAAIGLDHLDQLTAQSYSAIPTIGSLFVLDVVAAGVIAGALGRPRLCALRLLLVDLDLRVDVGLLHEELASGPPEGPDDEDDAEDDVPGGDRELLAERVGGRGGGVGHVAERCDVGGLGDA